MRPKALKRQTLNAVSQVLEANVLRQLLEHYFRLVRTSILDAVPKAIMLMMVNCVQVASSPKPRNLNLRLDPSPE
jgi:hypothetical protein